MSEFNMFHRKMSDLVSFSMFRFNLVIKLRNLGFESNQNTSIFFDKKKMMSDYILPNSV